MTFSEEVPANFTPRCDCKRRNCPLQAYYLDRAHGGKRFFRYCCSDPKIWAVCLRHIEVSDKPAKLPETPKQPAQEQPKTEPKTTQKLTPTPEPTKQQTEHRCNRYPYDCWQCSPAQQDKCGTEEIYRKPPT